MTVFDGFYQWCMTGTFFSHIGLHLVHLAGPVKVKLILSFIYKKKPLPCMVSLIISWFFSGFFLKSVLKRGHFHHVNSTFWKQHHWETELTHLCVICFMFNKTLKIMSFSDLNPWCPCFFSYFQLYRFTFLWPSISSGKNTLFFGWRDKTCSDNFVLSLHSLFYLSQKIDGLYIVKTLWYQILFVVKY